MELTPEQLIAIGPKTPDQLIGKARRAAMVQSRKAAANHEGTPVKLMLYGDPGSGKSAAAKLIASAFYPLFIIERLSGQQITADHVREWIFNARHSSNAWGLRIVEEIDRISPQAEVLMLQYLDIMPRFNGLICTSNKSMGDLTDRFQSRFQAIEIQRPEPTDVARLIADRWPEIANVANSIALANRGDVRASLNDAQTHLDALRYA